MIKNARSKKTEFISRKLPPSVLVIVKGTYADLNGPIAPASNSEQTICMII